MPLIRLDDNGNDISKIEKLKKEEKEALEKTRKDISKRKKLKVMVGAGVVGYSAAAFAFFYFDPLLGVFLATIPSFLISSLNLIDD